MKIGKQIATYTVDEAEYIGSMRHHKYMENKEYRKECAVRAGAEAMVYRYAIGLQKYVAVYTVNTKWLNVVGLYTFTCVAAEYLP